MTNLTHTSKNTPALGMVAAERYKQIEEKGFDTDHDIIFNPSKELAIAACIYIDPFKGNDPTQPPSTWPWSEHTFNPKSRIEDLSRGIALAIAELDRLLYIEAQIKDKSK